MRVERTKRNKVRRKGGNLDSVTKLLCNKSKNHGARHATTIAESVVRIFLSVV